jgi:hypothetical protein
MFFSKRYARLIEGQFESGGTFHELNFASALADRQDVSPAQIKKMPRGQVCAVFVVG